MTDDRYHEDATCAVCDGPLDVHRDAVCEACVPERQYFAWCAQAMDIADAMEGDKDDR